MTTIYAKVIADSISRAGVRLLTFEARYPRPIHAEFMTHRDFSRNASSSRAIPVTKMIADVIGDPYIPIHWGKNQKGMQADKEVDAETASKAQVVWLRMRDQVVQGCKELTELGIHKQLANRPLEPFGHISVVFSATRINNFFRLRIHRMAMPEIHKLARCAWDAMQRSTPVLRGDELLQASTAPFDEPNAFWHLPYVSNAERADPGLTTLDLTKLSTARCARVSYLRHDGTPAPFSEDFALYDRLVHQGDDPPHMSPLEHPAFASPDPTSISGNLHGWVQLRKLIPNECSVEFKLPADEPT